MFAKNRFWVTGMILGLLVGDVAHAQTIILAGQTVTTSNVGGFPITVESGGTLQYTHGGSSFGSASDTLTITGTGVNGIGAIYSTAAPGGSILATVYVDGDATVGTNAGGGRLRFGGTVSGENLTVYAKDNSGGIPLVAAQPGSAFQLDKLTVAEGDFLLNGDLATGVTTREHRFDTLEVQAAGCLELFTSSVNSRGSLTLVTKADPATLGTITLHDGATLKGSHAISVAANVLVSGTNHFVSKPISKTVWEKGTFSGTGTLVKHNSTFGEGGGASLTFESGVSFLTNLRVEETGTVLFSGSTLGGNLTRTTGTLHLDGVTFAQDSTLCGISAMTGTNTIQENVTLTFDGTANQTVSGSLTGSGRVVKKGAGTLDFASIMNTYTGTTTVEAGTLLFSQAATGSRTMATSQILVKSGATLQFSATNALGVRNGNTVPDILLEGGTLHGSSGVYANIGKITLGEGAKVTSDRSESAYYFYDQINATGNASITAPNITIRQLFDFNDPNTEHGKIYVAEGKTLTISSRVNLEGSSQTGGVFKSGEGELVFTNTVYGMNGVDVINGTVTLAGTNTYTGTTTVREGGRLNLTGSVENSAVTVQTGGTLSGTGNAQSLTLQEGARLVLDLQSAAGKNFLSATNAVTLELGTELTTIAFEPWDDYMSLRGEEVTLLSGASLSAALENLLFDFSTIGGNIWIPTLTENSLVLSMNPAAVPEPATWLLLLGGLIGTSFVAKIKQRGRGQKS